MPFLSTLKVEELEMPGGKWKMLAPLGYRSKSLNCEIIVPETFITDFYSVPECLAGLVFKVTECPAVLHDWLYQQGRANGKVISRAVADALLLEAMVDCGFSLWRRQTIYNGVRIGGWVAWNNYRSAEEPREIQG